MMMTGGKKTMLIQKCPHFPPQSCVFDFVNLPASAEKVDLNDCIVGYTTKGISNSRREFLNAERLPVLSPFNSAAEICG